MINFGSLIISKPEKIFYVDQKERFALTCDQSMIECKLHQTFSMKAYMQCQVGDIKKIEYVQQHLRNWYAGNLTLNKIVLLPYYYLKSS